MTFSRLADICSKQFYKPAVIENGVKTEGVRSHAGIQSAVKNLTRYFGKRRIGEITKESLADYKQWRRKLGSLRTKAKNEPIKIATINRELAAMRRMMRFALSEGWLVRDIFFGAKAIVTSAETVRTRILSESEQERLLAACEGERAITYTRHHYGKSETVTATIKADNPHLKAIILLAVDAGMRRGEILKLHWKDIDLEAGIITVKGSNTKTETERIVPLTERAKAELENVRSFTPEGESRPFPFVDFKHGWQTAKRIAGIDDLHFHDLRASAITRWQRDGLPLAFASKIAGHSDTRTTSKFYTSADVEIVRELAETMNRSHAKADILDTEFVN
ncbi:MAG: site-specific integrase [Chloracidobacterium sp.]|nr:site-specific integrase [Chloracidobacterium sp.]